MSIGAVHDGSISYLSTHLPTYLPIYLPTYLPTTTFTKANHSEKDIYDLRMFTRLATDHARDQVSEMIRTENL